MRSIFARIQTILQRSIFFRSISPSFHLFITWKWCSLRQFRFSISMKLFVERFFFVFLFPFPPRSSPIFNQFPAARAIDKTVILFFPFRSPLSFESRGNSLKLNIFSILLLLPQINSIFLFIFVRFFRFIFRKSTRNLSQFKMKRNRVWVSPRRSHFSFKESPFLLLRSLIFLSSSLRRDPPKLVAVSLSGVGRAGWGGGGGKDDELAEPQGRYSLALLFSMQGDQRRVVEAETKALWFETITSGGDASPALRKVDGNGTIESFLKRYSS